MTLQVTAVPRGTDVTVDQDPSAALVVRAWLENGTEFRARLTSAGTTSGDQVPGEDLTFALASSPEAVVEAVRAWLADFVAAPPGRDDGRD